MAISQNLRFKAIVSENDDNDHPPGAALVHELSAGLANAGWILDEFDNWRDCGWSVKCRRGESTLELVVCQIAAGDWMLQINPYFMPGFIRRAFGKQASAMPVDVYNLAISVQQWLDGVGWLGSPLWCWDGFPDEKNSLRKPPPP